MYKLRYLSQARDDLISIKRYLTKESGSNNVALQYTEKLRNQCKKLSQLPGKIGQARPELYKEVRSFPYGNYIIFFRYNQDYLDIITIIERHRDVYNIFDKF